MAAGYCALTNSAFFVARPVTILDLVEFWYIRRFYVSLTSVGIR
jgi:hypothetical protein